MMARHALTFLRVELDAVELATRKTVGRPGQDPRLTRRKRALMGAEVIVRTWRP
jgi:hypothetical protein